MTLIVRFLTIVVIAVWFGGFTFYSTAVIATAQEVLHSHMRAGMITQQVTNWLNLISIPALAVCLTSVVCLRRHLERKWFRILTLAFVLMCVLQVALFAFHPVLDRQIVDRDIANEGSFYRLHRIYLIFSTAQWLATLVYLWAALELWRSGDERGSATTVTS